MIGMPSKLTDAVTEERGCEETRSYSTIIPRQRADRSDFFLWHLPVRVVSHVARSIICGWSANALSKLINSCSGSKNVIKKHSFNPEKGPGNCNI